VIHIYCGEDSVAARKAYSSALDAYRSSGYEVIQLTPFSLADLPKGLAESLSLFSEKKVFSIENLEKHGLKKSTKAKKNELYEALMGFAQDKRVEIIDYEEGKGARLLKLKDSATVHESKLDTSIFQFIELWIPGNKQKCIDKLHILMETQDELFIFIMLARHIRQVVLASKDALPPKLAPWQKYKVQAAAKKWTESALMGFYEGLIRIEIGIKSSSNPYGVAKSLEILACHYL